MRNWDQLVFSYIDFCTDRGLKESTLIHRRSALQKFGLWLKAKSRSIKIESITEKEIIEYIKSRSYGKSKSTIAGLISHLKSFGDWLCMNGVWQKNPLKWIEKPKIDSLRQIPRILSKKQILEVYKETYNHHVNYCSCLYPAVFSILYATGMRRGELLALEMEDWNEKELTFRVKGEKIGEERLVPIPKDVAKVFERYLNARSRILLKRDIFSEKLVFINQRAKPLCGTNLLQGLKAASLRAGVPDFKLHALRHGCASDLLEAGVHISKVQQLLGHSCIESTYRYTHIASSERRKAMDLHPINTILGGQDEK